MNILVINSGSSSLKFRLFENKGQDFKVLCKGIVDGIGLKTCEFRMENGKIKIAEHVLCKGHKEALNMALNAMLKHQFIPSLDAIKAIGHRVVHGGEHYRKAVKITPHVIRVIRELSELAPLHNPPNLKGILACKKFLPKVPQIAVFDTAFHETLPPKAYLYALPYDLYKRHGIRRYGFHGTSHQYVTEKARALGAYKKIVSCHMGNGSSIAAVLNGKSVDTSMGLTPLEGIPMGTRSGDIDSAIIFHLLKQHRLSADKIEKMLIHESGLKGLSGMSSDVRDLWAAVKKRNKRAILTFEILCYRIAKYIAGYAAAMNGLDAVVFTAGIGENAYYLRTQVCSYLRHLGVRLNEQKNRKNALIISTSNSKVAVLVIPTNEEEQIAKETHNVLR